MKSVNKVTLKTKLKLINTSFETFTAMMFQTRSYGLWRLVELL